MAGGGEPGFIGDGGPATSASLIFPGSVAVDAAGNIYIADSGTNRIRKVSTNGIITTVAGNGNARNDGDGGPATSAAIYGGGYNLSIALDDQGNLFIGADNVVRKVSPNGIITTVAGNNVTGFSGDGGPTTQASLNHVNDIAIDKQGNLFIADRGNGRVRRVNSNGVITTIAGNGNSGYSGDGGPATNAAVTPISLAVDNKGNLFITHQSTYFNVSNRNEVIRKVDANGIITNVVSSQTKISGVYGGDGGPATEANLSNPQGLAIDGQGNLYISDLDNGRVRVVNANGIITTVVAGITPWDVALDGQGRLYVANTYIPGQTSNRILRVDLNLANQPPTLVGGGITTPQSATLGVAFSTTTAYAFRDPEGRALTFSSSSLPPGLSINATTGVISGTPTKVDLFGVTVGATDDGGSTVYNGFYLTVNPTGNTNPNPGTGSFAITGATVSCSPSPSSANARLVSITPQYSGLNGSAVTFSIDGESVPTTQPGPYTVTLYNDNPAVTLRAVQSGVTVTYRLAYQSLCNSGGSTGNQAPVVANLIPAQSGTVNTFLLIAIPSNIFRDPDGNPITLSVTNLPPGLSFNAPTSAVSGFPTQAGSFTATVIATDNGGLSVSTPLLITIAPVGTNPGTGTTNQAPVVVTPIPAQIFLTGVPFSLTIPSNTFRDPDGDPLTLSVTLAGSAAGGGLPSNLSFNRSTNTLTGTITDETGGFSGIVTASDGRGGSVSTPILIVGNNSPVVANPIPAQSGTVGTGFSFTIPPNTFRDPDLGPLTLSVTSLPPGLSFNSSTSAVTGVPTTAGTYTSSVTITDYYGAASTTPLVITINPSGNTNPGTGSFAITGATVSCASSPSSANARLVSISPQYSGLNGSAVAFSVDFETLPTTQAGPYTLTLYNDNPAVTLRATQSGVTVTYRLAYQSLCNNGGSTNPGTGNQAPVVANLIPGQSGTVGTAFNFTIPGNTFRDPDGDPITLSAAFLPAGLSFNASTGVVSGVPTTAGIYVGSSVTATDNKGASVSTPLLITIGAASTNPGTGSFAITGATVNCSPSPNSANARRVSITPQYSGLNGSAVTFSIDGESLPTTQAGPYTVTLYNDNPVVTLRAVQSGVTVTYRLAYQPLCNGSGRVASSDVVEQLLSVRVLGNPTPGESAEVEVRGAEGKSLGLELVDSQGRVISTKSIEQAAEVERQTLRLGRSAGVYVLRVSTPGQQQTVKIIRQ